MTPTPFGPYVLIERLGSGSTGDTFLALRDGSPRVIKRLHADLTKETEFVDRFRHEAEVAATVSSPHVARVYESGRVGETLFIAMEYVEGWTIARIMRELVRTGAVASPEACVAVIGDALEGLTAIHEATDRAGRRIELVHRDVAPQNLLVGTDKRTRLIDLGLGKSRLGAWRTRTGRVMGSPGYMSPERVLAGRADHRADLYAVGVVLHDLLTLENLVPPGPVHEMLEAARAPKRRPLEEARPDAPPELEPVLARALAIDPSDRFDSAREMRTALREAVAVPRTEDAVDALITRMMWSELESTRVDHRRHFDVIPMPPAVAPRRSPVRYAGLAAVAVLLAAVAYLLLRAPRVPQPLPAPVGASAPSVRARPAATRVSPAPSPPAVAAPPPPPPPHRRSAPPPPPPPRATRDAGAPREAPQSFEPVDVRARIDDALARAGTLRRVAKDPSAIDAVIAELMQLRFDDVREDHAARISALERRLDDLATDS